jgi:hypothetical protein
MLSSQASSDDGFVHVSSQDTHGIMAELSDEDIASLPISYGQSVRDAYIRLHGFAVQLSSEGDGDAAMAVRTILQEMDPKTKELEDEPKRDDGVNEIVQELKRVLVEGIVGECKAALVDGILEEVRSERTTELEEIKKEMAQACVRIATLEGALKDIDTLDQGRREPSKRKKRKAGELDEQA